MIRIGWVVKSVAQWGTMDSIVKTRRAGASQESFELEFADIYLSFCTNNTTAYHFISLSRMKTIFLKPFQLWKNKR